MSRIYAVVFLAFALSLAFSQTALAQTQPNTAGSTNNACTAGDYKCAYGKNTDGSLKKDADGEVCMQNKPCSESCQTADDVAGTIQGACVSQNKCGAETTCNGQKPQQVTTQQVQGAVNGTGGPSPTVTPDQGTTLPAAPPVTIPSTVPSPGNSVGASALEQLLNPVPIASNPNLLQPSNPNQTQIPFGPSLSGGTVDGITPQTVTTLTGIPSSAQPTTPLSPTTQYPTDTFGQPTISGTTPADCGFWCTTSETVSTVKNAVGDALNYIGDSLVTPAPAADMPPGGTGPTVLPEIVVTCPPAPQSCDDTPPPPNPLPTPDVIAVQEGPGGTSAEVGNGAPQTNTDEALKNQGTSDSPQATPDGAPTGVLGSPPGGSPDATAPGGAPTGSVTGVENGSPNSQGGAANGSDNGVPNGSPNGSTNGSAKGSDSGTAGGNANAGSSGSANSGNNASQGGSPSGQQGGIPGGLASFFSSLFSGLLSGFGSSGGQTPSTVQLPPQQTQITVVGQPAGNPTGVNLPSNGIAPVKLTGDSLPVLSNLGVTNVPGPVPSPSPNGSPGATKITTIVAGNTTGSGTGRGTVPSSGYFSFGPSQPNGEQPTQPSTSQAQPAQQTPTPLPKPLVVQQIPQPQPTQVGSAPPGQGPHVSDNFISSNPTPAQPQKSLAQRTYDAISDLFVSPANASPPQAQPSLKDIAQHDLGIARQSLDLAKTLWSKPDDATLKTLIAGRNAAFRLAGELQNLGNGGLGGRVLNYVGRLDSLKDEANQTLKNVNAVNKMGDNLLQETKDYLENLPAFKPLGTPAPSVTVTHNPNPATEGPPPPTPAPTPVPTPTPTPTPAPAPAQKTIADALAPLCNTMGGCGNICNSSSPLTCRTNNPGALTCGVAGTCSTIAKNYGGISCGQNNNTACFPTLEQGVAAQAALLAGPRYFGGANPTIQSAICNSYATNAAGNDCASYAATVSKLTGIPENQTINPNDKVQLGAIMMAMSRVESGKGVLYTPQQLQKGLEIAAGGPVTPGTWNPSTQPCNYRGCAAPTPNPQVAASRDPNLTSVPSCNGASGLCATDPTIGASFSCQADQATCINSFQQQFALSRMCASDPSTCNTGANSFKETPTGNVAPLSPQQVQQKINDYLWSHMSNESMSTIVKSATQAGLTPEQYAIGGMDPKFKENLYFAGQAMDKANVPWSIVNGYRSDYNQQLICGTEGGSACAPPGWSYHGGSQVTGGYGHGMAADISGAGQQWLLANGQQFGIGHPYSMSYDAPHFAPTDSPEYIKQQGQPSVNYQSVLSQQQTQLASLFPQQTYNLIGPDGNPVLGPDGNPVTTTQTPGSDGTSPFLTNPDGSIYLDKNGNPVPVNPVQVQQDSKNPNQYNAPDDRPQQPAPANPWRGRTAGNPYNAPGTLQPAQIAQAQQPRPAQAQPPYQTQPQPVAQPLPLPQLPPPTNPAGTPTSGNAVVTIVANPTSVASSSTSRIVWSSVGMVSCQVGPQSGALIGTSTNGTARTAPLATSTVFIASCVTQTNSNVTATTSVKVQ